jgi:hypothetical protein
MGRESAGPVTVTPHPSSHEGEPVSTLYVSGPMTGHPNYNFPAFHEAAGRLRAAGHNVLNPADNWGGVVDIDRHLCMKLDIAQVLMSDGIALLDGWRNSRGARVEMEVAYAIGLDIQPVQSWIDESEAVRR